MRGLILFLMATCSRATPAQTCTQQCETLADCADEVTLDRCVQDCSADSGFGACMARAGCREYKRRLAMDLDLVGTCEAELQRSDRAHFVNPTLMPTADHTP